MSDCHSVDETPVLRISLAGQKLPMIALAGQPNMGKSTLLIY